MKTVRGEKERRREGEEVRYRGRGEGVVKREVIRGKGREGSAEVGEL